MEFDIGDIVQTDLYEASILFRIVCFFDRPDRVPCCDHLRVPAMEGADDVHLNVVWKFHEAISSWEVGEFVVMSSRALQEPTGNEMLVLGLAAA